jgi:hypothetical protein
MEMAKTYTGAFAFISKHLNGDYSLARSYWVNTVLLQVVIILLATLLPAFLGDKFAARYSSASILFLTIFGIAAWVWAISGTWASANKHVSRGGSQGWATTAKVVIVLGMLRTAGEAGNIVESLSEHWKVAIGQQFGPDVTFQVRADGKSLLLTGGINDGTAEALRKALDMAPSVSTIVLQSTGGWIRQGNMIAKIISERGLNTYVEQECSSACTIAFLAGRERAAEPNAQIGFHSFKVVGANSASINLTDTSAVQEVYRAAGLSPMFISKILAVPSEKMWYPSHDELLAEGVLTRMSVGGETAALATSVLTRASLSTEFLKIPAYRAIAMKYPEEYEKLIDKAWAQVQARRPDNEVTAAARAQIGELTSRLLPITSDTTLLNFSIFVAEEVETVGKKSPETCVEMVFPTGKPINIGALVPKGLAQRELALMAEMVNTSDLRNARHFSDAESQKAFQPILERLTTEQLQFLLSPQLREKSPRDACDATIAYLKAINSIPENERAHTIRALYSSK